MTSYIRTYNSHQDISASLKEAAVDLSSRIPDDERLSLRQTASGRAVAVSFKGYEGIKLANIYLDEIEQVAAIEHRRIEWTRAKAHNLPPSLKSKKSKAQYFVTEKMSGERLRIKKEGEEVTTRRYMRRTRTEDVNVFVPPEHKRIPESIKNFVIHFIVNIRKIICPKKGAGQKLSAGSQGLISGLQRGS